MRCDGHDFLTTAGTVQGCIVRDGNIAFSVELESAVAVASAYGAITGVLISVASFSVLAFIYGCLRPRIQSFTESREI